MPYLVDRNVKKGNIKTVGTLLEKGGILIKKFVQVIFFGSATHT